jgi:hypothetical protein
MHPERVVIARVSAVVTAVLAITIVVAVVIVAATVGAIGSLLLGHLFLNIKIVIISSGGRPRARATIVGVVAIPIVLRFGRHLLVVFPLHASNARRPSNGSKDFLLLDRVARCDSSGRDTPSAGPLDLDGSLSSHRFASSIDGSLAPCLNSKLLGDTMAAAWVQNIALWN